MLLLKVVLLLLAVVAYTEASGSRTCSGDVCRCVCKKGKGRYKGLSFPASESFNCTRKPTVCEKKRFKGLLKEKYAPECDESGNYVFKRCGNVNACNPPPPDAINCGAVQAVVEDEFILVTDSSRGIYKLDIQTESVQRIDVDVSLSDSRAIAYDHQNRRVYWSDWDLDTIRSCLLNGSDAEVLVTDSEVNGMAIDHTNRQLYYTDHYRNIIYKVSLDGGNPVEVVNDQGTAVNIRDIVVDARTNQIIWTNRVIPSIDESDLDGSNRRVLVSGNMLSPYGIAVDENGICWSDVGFATVECVDRDGSNRRTLYTGTPPFYNIEMTASFIYLSAYTRTLLRLDRATSLVEEFGPATFDSTWDIHLHVPSVECWCVDDKGIERENSRGDESIVC